MNSEVFFLTDFSSAKSETSCWDLLVFHLENLLDASHHVFVSRLACVDLKSSTCDAIMTFGSPSFAM